MAKVPSGGPATVNGILYQMLWTLVRASRIRVVSQDTGAEGTLDGALLIAEPRNGGDLQLRANGETLVEQIKARPAQGAWSLREIVKDVLPDLYLACRTVDETVHFRFVTEGRIGDWKDVAAFFASLAGRQPNNTDLRAGLDDTEELKFRKNNRRQGNETEPFWGEEKYTERRLFDRIVAEVRRRRAVQAESNETTQENLWRLLANLKFVWRQSQDRLTREIDALLRAVVNHREDVPRVRDALITDLARRATSGDAEIIADELFLEHGISAIPLTQWDALRSRASTALHQELSRRKYDPDADVRANAAHQIATAWPRSASLLALEGESGFGKTWQLFAMADWLTSDATIPLYVEALGDFRYTLAAAAQIFSERIWQQDQPLSLGRIADRRREFHHGSEYWLTLFIDNLQSTAEARQIALQPWNDWGIRVVVGCHPRVVDTVRETTSGSFVLHHVDVFSLPELHAYLEHFLGSAWSTIRPDVLETLRQPLLASLFIQSIVQHEWTSENEYDLFHTFWQRLFRESNADHPLDQGRLLNLVRCFLNGDDYPWSASQLGDARIGDDAIARLDRAGWLRANGDGRFEIPHDRLLNWAVGVALSEDFKSGKVTLSMLGDRLRGYATATEHPANRYLGYAPMDVIWQICRDESVKGSLVDLVPMLFAGHSHRESFYSETLPTIGDLIAETMFAVLRRHAGAQYEQSSIIDGIAKLSDDAIRAFTKEMLDGEDRRLQRSAMAVLAKRPLPDCLDRLWMLHCESRADPVPWLEEHESEHQLYDDIFAAMNACCEIEPAWLGHAIVAADPQVEPVHDLAYLLSELHSREVREIWRASKPQLLEKVRPDNVRSLAKCMSRFPDVADRDWLIEQLDCETDRVSPSAMKALMRVDAAAAIENLNRVPIFELLTTTAWCLSELFMRDAGATVAKLKTILETEPQHLFYVLEGNTYFVDGETLDLLLDRLSVLLLTAIDSNDAKKSRLFRELRVIAAMNSAEQLERFAKRVDTPLEQRLIDFVERIGPRKGVGQDSLERNPAIEILCRIGGSGCRRAIDMQLSSDSAYSQLDGLESALKYADETVLERCREILLRDEFWDKKTPLLQNSAAKVLAAYECWNDVLLLFEKHWPQVFTSLTTPLRRITKLPKEIVGPLRQRVSEEHFDSAPGLVAFLGYGRQETDIPLIRGILAKVDSTSELAHACVIALEMLGDHSQESVPLLVQQLDTRHAHSARWTLIRNRCDTAVDALLAHFEKQFALDLATNLINHPRTSARAIELTQQHLRRLLQNQFWDWQQTVNWLLDHVVDQGNRQAVFADEEFHERLLTDAFADERHGTWFVGSKATAIRGVATFDTKRAMEAVTSCLRNPDSRDRQYYPYILVEIDKAGAVGVLLPGLETEASPTVAAAIGRALAPLDLLDVLRRGLASDSTEKQIAACRAIGWSDAHCTLEVDVRKLLASHHDPVVVECLETLRRIQLVNEAVQLVDRLNEETNIDRRWALLDALLETGDPGEKHRPLAQWASAIGPNLTPFQSSYLVDRLTKRRKKLDDQLSKAR